MSEHETAIYALWLECDEATLDEASEADMAVEVDLLCEGWQQRRDPSTRHVLGELIPQVDEVGE